MDLAPTSEGPPMDPFGIDYIEFKSSCAKDPSVIFHIANI